VIDLTEIRNAFAEFESIDPLGEPSGQKFVFLAKKAGADPVVLKVIKPATVGPQRMNRELEAAVRVQSPHVPSGLDSGSRLVAGVDVAYLIEEYVPGQTLKDYLALHGALSLEQTLGFGRQLLAAACDFETASLVHRDVKPANIIVSPEGTLWVLDFGIVRLLDDVSLTATSAPVGPCTPGYASPEQMRNRKESIDIRADLYSIGIVMHEMITGRNSYVEKAKDMIHLLQITQAEDLPRLRNVPPAVADLIDALSARFPSRRPATATDALAWIDEVISTVVGA